MTKLNLIRRLTNKPKNKKVRLLFKLCLSLPGILVMHSGFAQNPFVRDIYTADPSAHVWSDGRLYVYPSHDVAPPRGCDLMDRYHVYSTDDMVNWTDHGEILNSEQVNWGRPEGGFMWAPDCAYKNGVYYFYFPHPSNTEWNNSWKIGVATSTDPAANFTVQGYISGLKSMIDPCVFVDDDGQAYLYYGGGNHCEGGKLKENMMEIDGAMQEMAGLEDFHEATWVHKRNGVYYLSYADNNSKGGNQLRYATSNNPLGPWISRGVYMEPTGSSTDHGSIVEFKGQWYAFYHNSILSGNDWLRSVCVDSLFYNGDGTIQKVNQSRSHGTPYAETKIAIPGILEVENYDLGGQGVAYNDNDVINSGGMFRPNEGVDIEDSGTGGFNVGWTNGGEWLEYTVDVTETGTYTVQSMVASPDGKSSIHLKIDGTDVTGSIYFPATGGWQQYSTVTTAGIKLKSGIHILQLFEETGGFNIDKITFTKEIANSSEQILLQQMDFQLFPNPATTNVTIVTPEGLLPVRIEIYDLQGRRMQAIQTGSIPEKQFRIDTSGLNPGSYIVKLIADLFIQTKKLLIK